MKIIYLEILLAVLISYSMLSSNASLILFLLARHKPKKEINEKANDVVADLDQEVAEFDPKMALKLEEEPAGASLIKILSGKLMLVFGLAFLYLYRQELNFPRFVVLFIAFMGLFAVLIARKNRKQDRK